MRLLKFGADWCRPCNVLDRELDKLSDEVEVVRINVEEDTGVAQLHGIRSVPTIIILDDDQEEVARLHGWQTAATIREVFQ